MRSHFEYTMKKVITVNWIHLIEPHFKLIRAPQSLWIYSIPQRYRSTVDDDVNLLSVQKLSGCCKPLSIAEIGAGSFEVICRQPNHSATSHSFIFTFTNIFYHRWNECAAAVRNRRSFHNGQLRQVFSQEKEQYVYPYSQTAKYNYPSLLVIIENRFNPQVS